MMLQTGKMRGVVLQAVGARVRGAQKDLCAAAREGDSSSA